MFYCGALLRCFAAVLYCGALLRCFAAVLQVHHPGLRDSDLLPLVAAVYKEAGEKPPLSTPPPGRELAPWDRPSATDAAAAGAAGAAGAGEAGAAGTGAEQKQLLRVMGGPLQSARLTKAVCSLEGAAPGEATHAPGAATAATSEAGDELVVAQQDATIEVEIPRCCCSLEVCTCLHAWQCVVCMRK